MQILVKTDVAKCLKAYLNSSVRQIPFAVALGRSMTAKMVIKVKQRMMVKKLDRPTPFTIKSVKWQGAKKADFTLGRVHSRVYVMD